MDIHVVEDMVTMWTLSISEYFYIPYPKTLSDLLVFHTHSPESGDGLQLPSQFDLGHQLRRWWSPFGL